MSPSVRKSVIAPLDLSTFFFFLALTVGIIDILFLITNNNSYFSSSSMRGSSVPCSYSSSISFAYFPLSFPLGPASYIVSFSSSMYSMVGFIHSIDQCFNILGRSYLVTKYGRGSMSPLDPSEPLHIPSKIMP